MINGFVMFCVGGWDSRVTPNNSFQSGESKPPGVQTTNYITVSWCYSIPTPPPPPNTYLPLGYISRLYDQGLIFTHWFPLKAGDSTGAFLGRRRRQKKARRWRCELEKNCFRRPPRGELVSQTLGWEELIEASPKKSGEWKNPKTTEQWSCFWFQGEFKFCGYFFLGGGAASF